MTKELIHLLCIATYITIYYLFLRKKKVLKEYKFGNLHRPMFSDFNPPIWGFDEEPPEGLYNKKPEKQEEKPKKKRQKQKPIDNESNMLPDGRARLFAGSPLTSWEHGIINKMEQRMREEDKKNLPPSQNYIDYEETKGDNNKPTE